MTKLSRRRSNRQTRNSNTSSSSLMMMKHPMSSSCSDDRKLLSNSTTVVCRRRRSSSHLTTLPFWMRKKKQQWSYHVMVQVFATVALLLLTTVTTVTAAATAAASSNGKDWFDVVDANHDGMIDRTEYDEGLDKFLAEIEAGTSSSGLKRNNNRRASTAWLMDVFSYEGTGYWKAFTSSVAMILATEIGDKTFFIAAVLSMKHARVAVFTGAIAALTIMTVLSTAMGLVLPKFMDKKYTHILSGILFLYFGIKLILDSRKMEGGKVSEELEEVEEKLLHQGRKKKKGEDEETGQAQPTLFRQTSQVGSNNSSGMSTHSVILTALTLTFVAEWGDRSQIATIALASSKNPIGVTIGGIVGHSICTASACIGGRMLASNISEKTVCQWGGVVFLLFSIHSLFFEE